VFSLHVKVLSRGVNLFGENIGLCAKRTRKLLKGFYRIYVEINIEKPAYIKSSSNQEKEDAIA
jgi:hypothetical protein